MNNPPNKTQKAMSKKKGEIKGQAKGGFSVGTFDTEERIKALSARVCACEEELDNRLEFINHLNLIISKQEAEIKSTEHLHSVLSTAAWALEVSKRESRRGYVDVKRALNDLVESWKLYQVLKTPSEDLKK